MRTIQRKNRDGSTVEYVQLAHNAWNPEKGFAQAEVLYSFGRKDQLDIEAIKRLANSLCRFLAPEDALRLQAKTGEQGPLPFVRSRSAGGAFLLNALWERLNLAACLKAALKVRKFTASVERALFAMVVKQEEALDGKYLLSTSDESLSAEDVALGYKQPLEVGRAFRTLKSSLSLQPFFHSKEDRIRSHVPISWLALLLVHIAEVETGMSWTVIRRIMQRLHLVEFKMKKPAAPVHRVNERLPPPQEAMNRLC